MKHILITYALYGMGHVKATEALGSLLNKDFEVSYFNLSMYSHPFLENILIKLHKINVTYFPFIYKFFYYKSSNFIYNFIVWFYGNKKVYKRLIKLNPDIVIATHFLSEATLVYLKRKYHLKYKICFLLTDYHVYNYMIMPQNKIDTYFVATNELKKSLIENDIKENHICVSSIPVNNKFHTKMNKNDICKKYNLNKKKKIVTYICGGLGINSSLRYFKELLRIDMDFQIVFIAGKNIKLKRKVEKIVKNYNKKVTVLGYTTSINELFYISSFIIGKPGGLITSECLTLNKMFLAVLPIIGQESENALYLEKNHLGIYVKDRKSFKKKVKFLLKNDIKPRYYKTKYNYLKAFKKMP